MMQEPQLHVGDRIRTNFARVGLPAGSLGTVRMVFHSMAGAYDVLFDGTKARRITFRSEITLLPAARRAGALKANLTTCAPQRS